MIRDRLSWMRFFSFDLGGAMPHENTIRHYRNRLTESGTLEALMQAFEQQLREAGYLAMGGQIAMMRKRSQSGGLASTECWCLRPSSATPRTKRPRPKQASRLGRSGGARRTRLTRRMSLHAGLCSSAARSPTAPTGRRCRRSPRPCLAISRISASTGAMGSSARQR